MADIDIIKRAFKKVGIFTPGSKQAVAIVDHADLLGMDWAELFEHRYQVRLGATPKDGITPAMVKKYIENNLTAK